MEKYTKYSKEIIEEAVKNNFTLSDVMRSLNLKPRGSNFSRFKKMIVHFQIDTTHFKQPGSPGSVHTIKTFTEEILILNGKGWNSNSIKKKLFEFNLMKNECSLCGSLPVWNGQPLTLQLDHIDGNHRNNELNNLRILCPNCHSQTDNYSAKNINRV